MWGRTDLGTVPPGAFALLEHYTSFRQRSGEPPRWPYASGVLEVLPGSGDLYPDFSLAIFQLHLEFALPRMPEAQEKNRANSGVYLDGRYEIQLLDSLELPPGPDTCGAIYGRRAPDYNAALPPLSWQALDVAYRRHGEAASITAFLNGVLIHNQVLVDDPTAGALLEGPRPVILLQDHGAPVRFRNIWVLPSR